MTDREPHLAWRIPLAVYGTLRRGDRNHRLIEHATFLGTGTVEGTLHHVPVSPARAYGFPVLLDGGVVRVFDGPVDEAQIYRSNGPTDVLGEVIGGGDWLAFEQDADS